ncbi:DNA/RNA nuclease SfsA [Veillonella agrestimuris]|uniref:DNA/RNA nuclease SfsA n=1 Tax=Veillonella agrestimuris TaxID=2941340 RepID=UPI00203C1EB5|nr:DNA/RNA nuclease SfsA [Veillonella agrestimuris]
MKVLYDTVLKATYQSRPNRFVVNVDVNGESALAHLPNPGRMWELLFPGVTMYVVDHHKPDGKTKYRVVGIKRDGKVIMLDTNYSNDVAQHLIEHKLIPGWEEWRVVRREYTVGKSRFDLLLTNDAGDDFLLEVKSCTLFSNKGAMFPDAITERGRKHLLHLQELQQEGYHTGVLFLVQWDRAQWFLPDYHTDLEFAKTFQDVAPSLDWKAVAVAWDETFTMPSVAHECVYAPHVLDKEAHDSGVYLMVMYLDHELELEVGSKGMMQFRPGYYIYVGSAKTNLTKRIERHKRKRKKMHWHMDYFRSHCDMIAGLPIRTSRHVECALADAVRQVAQWDVPQFGSSDCECTSHLFGMTENPIHHKGFMDVVEEFRMNHLDAVVDEHI